MDYVIAMKALEAVVENKGKSISNYNPSHQFRNEGNVKKLAVVTTRRTLKIKGRTKMKLIKHSQKEKQLYIFHVYSCH